MASLGDSLLFDKFEKHAESEVREFSFIYLF